MSLARATPARVRRACALACVLACASAGAAQADAAVRVNAGMTSTAAPAARAVGLLTDPRLREVSGLAASRRHAGRWWLHNDSGNGNFLYAVDAAGTLQGTLQVDDVMAVDWEDIASFERDGKAYLLIADSGDNLGLRGEYVLVAVEEPELPADGALVHAASAWQVRYRYDDDKPHDTEAMAVDAAHDAVYLVPKFVEPLAAYRIALNPRGDGAQVAQRAFTFAPPAGVSLEAAPKFRTTAFDIAADGRHAALLGYRSAWLYARDGAEAWSTAFARAPQRIGVSPPLRQPEALGFSTDGKALFVTGEGGDQPLLRVDVPSG